GLVPAAAGQAELRGGQLAVHPAFRAAGRAGGGVGIGQFLQSVEGMPAGIAGEGVDRHARGRGSGWGKGTGVILGAGAGISTGGAQAPAWSGWGCSGSGAAATGFARSPASGAAPGSG